MTVFSSSLVGRRLGAMLLILGAVACDGVDGGTSEMVPLPGADLPPFSGSAPSLTHLGRGLLQAYARADSTALAAWRLTEEEHNLEVFPELPAGQPEVNYPLDMAWQNIELRSGRALPRQIAWFAGREVEHRETQCRGETQLFGTFVVHTDCWVIFADAERGLLEVQFFKDALERGGGVKIFRYYDDPPRPLGGV